MSWLKADQTVKMCLLKADQTVKMLIRLTVEANWISHKVPYKAELNGLNSDGLFTLPDKNSYLGP